MIRQVGKYQLIRKLASGDTAEVFLARAAGPLGFEKTLVVKCILPHLAREPSFVEMFLSEATLAARLTHPNIVQIFDFGEADGSYFLAMEYVDGPSLRTLLRRASARRLPLPPEVCARLISRACEGLAFAHDVVDPDTGEPLGLIHREVSPDHLLLSRQGAVKVVDFGIARASGRSHRTRGVVSPGKRAYMAPEQLRARHLDRRADVYALGVVLHELLTFHKPLGVAPDAAPLNPRLREEPVPAVHPRPEVPEALRRILCRALARERHQRYPDCHALQAELEDFILAEGRTVTAQQVAQLIHRATSGTGLPAQRSSRAVVPRPRPAAPPRVAASEPALDPAAEWPPFRAPFRASLRGGRSDPGAPTSLSEYPVAAPEVSLAVYPPTSAWAETRTRPPPEASSWTRQALVGGLLLVASGGLLPWKRSTTGVEASVMVLPRVSSSTPPAEAFSRALEQVPREPAPGAEEAQPSTRERIARSVKSRRPFPAAALGSLDVHAHPYAIYAVVSVDGMPSGTTPLDKALELPVGTYTVTLTSPTLSKTVTRRVEVKPGVTTPLTVSFLQEE